MSGMLYINDAATQESNLVAELTDDAILTGMRQPRSA